MNLVDSSGWLEYFADSSNAKHFSSAIENTAKLITPTVSIYEVYKFILRQRGENLAMQAVALMNQSTVIDLTTAIALDAATIGHEFKLPMADSIIYATAQLYNATIFTQDVDFEKMPNVKYFKKK